MYSKKSANANKRNFLDQFLDFFYDNQDDELIVEPQSDVVPPLRTQIPTPRPSANPVVNPNANKHVKSTTKLGNTDIPHPSIDRTCRDGSIVRKPPGNKIKKQKQKRKNSKKNKKNKLACGKKAKRKK